MIYYGKVYDDGKSSLNLWAIYFETSHDMMPSKIINDYCMENECEPISISQAYNNVAFGGCLQVTAIVKKKSNLALPYNDNSTSHVEYYQNKTVENKKICPECGKEISKTLKICDNCGYPFE